MSAIWLQTTALEALAAIRRGEVSALDLMRQTLAAIAAHDPKVLAFTSLIDEQAAIRAASSAASSGTVSLGGLPIGLKDIIDTTELPTAYGSALHSLVPARVDAALVGVIKRAGGVVIGKTATTEFAFLNPAPTRNPAAWDRTPGGSSAGSAAAVAAGLLPWAVGSQTGGSTIRPASYCGVVGFKPTFGQLPINGFKPFAWSLDTAGLFTRTVGDVAWLVRALSPSLGPIDPITQKTWVVGVPESYPWGHYSPSAALAIETASRAWASTGATIKPIKLPAMVAELFEAHGVIQGWEAARALHTEIMQNPAGLSLILRDYLLESQTISDEAYATAQALTQRYRPALTEWFKSQCDVWLTPSAPDEAPLGFESTGPSHFNRVWTLIGNPCISVPGALGVSGAPMGVQIIGPPGADLLVLQAAQMLESALESTLESTPNRH